MRFGLAIIVSFLISTCAFALETDQFDVPAKQLIDLGPVVSTKIAAELQRVIKHANATRAEELQLAATSPSRAWQKAHLDRACAAVSQPVLAKALYEAISGGSMYECRIESWLRDDRSTRPAFMLPMSVSDSIYGTDLFHRPLLMLQLAPTIRLYDQYAGTDKVGHFAQEGYEYYRRYLDARMEGRSEADAVKEAVNVGVDEEHGIFGEAIIGVYSNADLAANYSGFLFYRNLMEPIRIGTTELPPLIVWEGDHLKLTERASGNLLKPFVTEHWNEAMNPCRYADHWRSNVRERIARRVDGWMAFNHSTPQIEAERLQRVQTFYGQNYGHGGLRDVITLVNAKSHYTVATR